MYINVSHKIYCLINTLNKNITQHKNLTFNTDIIDESTEYNLNYNGYYNQSTYQW